MLPADRRKFSSPAPPLVAQQRHVQHAPEVLLIVVAQVGFQTAFELVDGLAGDVVDGPAHGVAPVQRALRSAQDLDPLQLQHVEQRADVLGDQHPVEVHAHRGVEGDQRFGVTDTPDVEGNACLAADVRLRVHIGRKLGEVQGVADAAVLRCAFSSNALMEIWVSCSVASRNSAVTTTSSSTPEVRSWRHRGR